jgi:hypothetical protein
LGFFFSLFYLHGHSRLGVGESIFLFRPFPLIIIFSPTLDSISIYEEFVIVLGIQMGYQMGFLRVLDYGLVESGYGSLILNGLHIFANARRQFDLSIPHSI